MAAQAFDAFFIIDLTIIFLNAYTINRARHLAKVTSFTQAAVNIRPEFYKGHY